MVSCSASHHYVLQFKQVPVSKSSSWILQQINSVHSTWYVCLFAGYSSVYATQRIELKSKNLFIFMYNIEQNSNRFPHFVVSLIHILHPKHFLALYINCTCSRIMVQLSELSINKISALLNFLDFNNPWTLTPSSKKIKVVMIPKWIFFILVGNRCCLTDCDQLPSLCCRWWWKSRGNQRFNCQQTRGTAVQSDHFPQNGSFVSVSQLL